MSSRGVPRPHPRVLSTLRGAALEGFPISSINAAGSLRQNASAMTES